MSDFRNIDCETAPIEQQPDPNSLAKQIILRTGPDSLPVVPHLSKIVQLIKDNTVTILRAETGAGKSTQVPKALLEAGCKVVVTQPRRIAAISLAERVSQELGEELGDRVGFRTGKERQDSNKTRLHFCTDGLTLMHEMIRGAGPRDVLILDEVHERNLNMEVLLSLCAEKLARGDKFKLVVMSATIDETELARFLKIGDQEPAIYNIPGRLYPIEEREPGKNICTDVEKLVADGRNTLVFLPGKREIAELQYQLESGGINAEILPLHGELTSREQSKCFQSYKRAKVILATNIAQTSITIPDIDAVIDSGLERRLEVHNGVEGLFVRPISLDDREQRKGRAGRTKEGIYIDHCDAYIEDRPQSQVPEIYRARLDKTILRLATIGLDMTGMSFLNQPDRTMIAHAKDSLFALGCMDKDGEVTAFDIRSPCCRYRFMWDAWFMKHTEEEW